MMALQILLLLQVIVILCTPSTLAYSIYGTKRYGRSAIHRVNPPYQTMLRTQRHPLNYYELYPYSPTYPDEYYYPQESYPMYYPPARTSKYEVYQAVLPYYYGDGPMPKSNYYNGYEDPVIDLQEEMMQEAEREEREESQPIGHELLYENEDQVNDDSLDDVNAAFLQNLIMSQMYKDALSNRYDYYNDYYPGEEYGKWEETTDNTKPNNLYQEDEDVKELKQLAKSQNNPDDIHWFQRSNFRDQKDKQNEYHYNNNNNKRSNFMNKLTSNKKNEAKSNFATTVLSDRKSIVKSTPSPVTSSKEPKRIVRGQKEEVLMRPATPVRHPFSEPVLEMITKNEQDKKRAPSVYDTIKHMLDMEKSLENKYGVDEIRPHMKKRIVSSEESLTHQLSVLKKPQ